MKTPILIITLFLILPSIVIAQDPKITEDWSKQPPIVTPGRRSKPPSDAIVLYKTTKDLGKWKSVNGESAKWKTTWCGMKVNGTGGIVSKQEFGDAQFHVEWKSPRKVDPKDKGQARGNSGIYIQGKYEVQILDSYENETYYNGQAGSVYKQSAPLVNACRKPGKWQSYDIIFHAPRFQKDGSLKSPATLTVFHNGVLIQNHYELKGETVYGGFPRYKAHPEKLPLLLQDHGDPVQYRNIWVREL